VSKGIQIGKNLFMFVLLSGKKMYKENYDAII